MGESDQSRSLFRADFPQLRGEVLAELVRLFSSGKDPIGLAEAAVELVADATGAKSVFVYFWDPDSERLVLRTVTRIDLALTLGTIQIRLGEGITGWSALHRKPVLINESPMKDPRFMAVDGVDENDYSSVLVVPIFDDALLYGVFAMYSSDDRTFGQEELAISEEVGLLLGSGLKRAETVRELELQSATARFLSDLPPASSSSLPAAIRESAKRILTLLDADACIIDYTSWIAPTSEPIAVAERATETDEEPKVWLTHSKQVARETEQRYEHAGYDHISSSLGFGIARGALTCYSRRRFTQEDVTRLGILATQVGVLVGNMGSVPSGAAQLVALLASDREEQIQESLKFLGWRGGVFTPILVQVKRIGSDLETFGRLIQESAYLDLGPDTLITQSGTLVVLLIQNEKVIRADGITSRVTGWISDLEARVGLSADVGIGQATNETTSVRTSLYQARTALAWASFSSTRRAPQVVDYDSIRLVFELPRLINDLAPEIQWLHIELTPVALHDAQFGTHLLETLEAYALHGGSAASTADALFIHRNTLRQRLGRIQALSGREFDQSSHWPEMLLAVRLLKLDLLQGSFRTTTPRNLEVEPQEPRG